MKYRTEIDGLRAVAVLPVIIFHAGLNIMPGGFVGVDVFFVISGYLITTIITDELDGGTFTIGRFYERRARRILPALFVVIATCIPAAWMLFLPGEMQNFGKSILSVLGFVSNIFFWLQSGYFDTSSELKPLLHTWSLAVEEQYYIFFPLLLMALWRFGLKRIWIAVILLFAGSLFASAFYTDSFPSAAYYLFPFRAWEIMMGSIAAILLRNPSKWQLSEPFCETLSGLGVALVSYAFFTFDKNTVFPGIAAFAPVFGVFLIIVFSQHTKIVKGILGNPVFVGIGLVSYSAYLWHQPLFSFARVYLLQEISTYQSITLIAITFVLAFLSWRFVEKPFRGNSGLSLGKTISILGGVSASIAVFSVVAFQANGLPGRDYVKSMHFANYSPDNSQYQYDSWNLLRRASGDKYYGVEKNQSDRKLWFDLTNPKKKLLIVGNSHSKDIYNTFRASWTIMQNFQVARFGMQISDLASGDMSLLISPNYEHADVIVLASRAYGNELQGALDTFVADEKLVVLLKPTPDFPVLYNRTLADLQVIAGVRDIGTEAFELESIYPINALHWAALQSAKKTNAYKWQERVITNALSKNPDIIALDRSKYQCSDEYRVCNGLGKRFQKHFYDGHHNTFEGAVFFAKRINRSRWFQPVLDRLATRQ